MGFIKAGGPLMDTRRRESLIVYVYLSDRLNFSAAALYYAARELLGFLRGVLHCLARASRD